jgi:hypothetical protein
LQVPESRGLVMDSVVPSKESKRTHHHDHLCTDHLSATRPCP